MQVVVDELVRGNVIQWARNRGGMNGRWVIKTHTTVCVCSKTFTHKFVISGAAHLKFHGESHILYPRK